MQTPSASDPSFKAFLDKLQEQNSRSFVTQLVQLKAEREIAGEDNDKREEQLDEIVSSLKEVRDAVTGIKIELDITPLVNIGENQTKLLDELFKETSLTRKLTEGSVEYSKEMAGYRNTSGRDVTNEVSGKVSKTGQVIDFETARDALSAQGKRAKEANAFDLKPIDYTPGKTVAAVVGAKSKSKDSGEVEDPVDRSLLGRIKDSAKFFMTDGLSEKDSKEVVKKERETKVSSPRQENPEADNVTSTGEIQADAAKSDLELSKQMLDTTREQLTELKAIREALAPSTPKELTEQKGAPSSTTEKEKEGGGSLLGDLASGAVDMLGRGKGVAGKAAGMGGKILGGLGKAARFLGPAAAVAGAAYSGVQGYQNTGANFDLKEGEDATVGQKTASTLGGVASGLTFGLLDEKSASQGIHKAGAAVGEAASAAGSFVSDKAKSIGSSVSGFFGGIGDKVKGVYNSGIGLNDQAKGVAMANQMVSSTGEVDTSDKSISKGPGFNVSSSERTTKEGVTAEKSVLGSTFLGGLFTAKGKESGSFLGTDAKESEVTGKVEGKVIDKSEAQYGRMLGKRVSGGLFGKDSYKVTSEMSGTGENSAEYDLEVSKGQYNELKELNAKGDVEGARKKLAEIKAKSAENAEALNIMSPEEMVSGASPILKGKDVAKTSTENADMGREASKGGSNNTVVSNNVSSNNTTKIVPMKANPRPEYTGSALDRYTSRIAVY
jgi:hypothetical protein